MSLYTKGVTDPMKSKQEDIGNIGKQCLDGVITSHSLGEPYQFLEYKTA